MEPLENGLDVLSALKTIVRELDDVIGLAEMSGHKNLAERLKAALDEARRLQAEAASERQN